MLDKGVRFNLTLQDGREIKATVIARISQEFQEAVRVEKALCYTPHKLFTIKEYVNYNSGASTFGDYEELQDNVTIPELIWN